MEKNLHKNNMSTTIFSKLIIRIIQAQEGIIGPIALEQAQKVSGLNVDWKQKEVEISGDEKSVVDGLIQQYKQLFGQSSVEFCKEAVKELIGEIPSDQRPSLLLP